jgi:hypothetical protein
LKYGINIQNRIEEFDERIEMTNKQPQYETMPERYLLCFNDECEQENSKLTELQSLLLAKMGQ